MKTSSKENLSINLKYYRLQMNLSQEKFAETIGSTLIYVNQLEKQKRNPSIDMLDKIANAISKNTYFDITGADLISYNKEHKTNYNRIDTKKTF